MSDHYCCDAEHPHWGQVEVPPIFAISPEQVADQHRMTEYQGSHCVGCGWIPDRPDEDSAHSYRRHVAEVAWFSAVSPLAPPESR